MFVKIIKSYELADVCKKYNIFPNEQEVTPDRSKRCYVLNGLEKVSDPDIWRLAKQILQDFRDIELAKQLEPYLGDELFTFTHITRRKILKSYIPKIHRSLSWAFSKVHSVPYRYRFP